MHHNLQSIKRRFGIIGRSEVLDNALGTAVRVAATDLTVLINGESGVGKEVFSRIIHELSPRKHNNFIAINCGAIPEGTINSELFGHEKGAFTGATGDRKGYFETVDGGTIFLDEIGEMPLDTQAFLLRILESGEFMRVGSSKMQRTDVRVIAATNVNLEENIKKGKFREDLFYRLNTVPIHVPSLRERKEDIYMLFRKFAIDFAERHNIQPIQLDEHAQLILEHYSWPGNIRELKNLAEQLSILSEERMIDGAYLSEHNPKLKQRNLPARSEDLKRGESFEEREILYKLLFEMKHDLNELKGLVFGLISNNDLSIPDRKSLNEFGASTNEYFEQISEDDYSDRPRLSEQGPILLDDQMQQGYERTEIIEESLSLEEMEKEMIKKALKKHHDKRKDAAEDLGISERTLYRKIKQYNL
jgi:DNA-binding NtrC family response regulator